MKTHFLTSFLLFIIFGITALYANQALSWKKFKFPDIQENTFKIYQNGHIDILMDNSSSLLIRELGENEKNSSFLKWQWKVDESFPATSMIDKDNDDRPVAVHIWFPKQKGDKNTGFKEFFGRLFGYNLPGRVITYIWGGIEEPFEIIENPHLKKRGYMIILKPGDFNSSDWVDEQVNFKNDYQQIFGENAPEPTHIAISGDSDDSMTTAKSSVRMIEFSNIENATDY